MVRPAGHPRRPVRCAILVPLRRAPRPLPAPAQGPPAPLRRVGGRHRPDVRHRPRIRPGARPAWPQPGPPRPQLRQSPGDLRDHQISPRGEDQDGPLRPLHRRHPSRRRGDGAAPGGHLGAGRRGAGEQRRRGEAGLAVPARGGREGVGEDDKGEPVGGDRGDGGGAAGDGGAGQGRRREHGVGVVGGHPLLPALHHVRRHQTVCCSVLQEPLRRVQKQGDRRAMPGPVLRGDRDGVEALGDQSPRPAPRRAGARRVRARGYALDRPRPAALRAQPQPPAPVVPRSRSAGPRPRLAPPAPQPAPPRPVLQTLVGKSSAKDQVTPQPQMELALKGIYPRV